MWIKIKEKRFTLFRSRKRKERKNETVINRIVTYVTLDKILSVRGRGTRVPWYSEGEGRTRTGDVESGVSGRL